MHGHVSCIKPWNRWSINDGAEWTKLFLILEDFWALYSTCSKWFEHCWPLFNLWLVDQMMIRTSGRWQPRISRARFPVVDNTSIHSGVFQFINLFLLYCEEILHFWQMPAEVAAAESGGHWSNLRNLRNLRHLRNLWPPLQQISPEHQFRHFRHLHRHSSYLSVSVVWVCKFFPCQHLSEYLAEKVSTEVLPPPTICGGLWHLLQLISRPPVLIAQISYYFW